MTRLERRGAIWSGALRSSAAQLRDSNPQQPARIAAGDGGDGRGIEAFDRGDMADRIEVGHVERIVGAHDDVVGAEQAHSSASWWGVNTTVSK